MFFSILQLFESSALQLSTHLPDMFSRLATLIPVAALVAVVTAAPNGNGGVSQCNTSDQYCCNQAISVGHLFLPFVWVRVLMHVFPRSNTPQPPAFLASSMVLTLVPGLLAPPSVSSLLLATLAPNSLSAALATPS